MVSYPGKMIAENQHFIKYSLSSVPPSLWDVGEEEDARTYFEQALQINPEMEDARKALKSLYRKLIPAQVGWLEQAQDNRQV